MIQLLIGILQPEPQPNSGQTADIIPSAQVLPMQCYRQPFWKHSGIEIYNESNLETMARMPDNSIDLVVTSPPYDKLRSYMSVFNINATAKELFRVTKEGGICVWIVADATVNGSETGTSFRQAISFMNAGWNLHDTMIYEKSGMAYPDSNRYHQVFEYMFVFSKGKPKTVNLIKDRENKYVGTMGGNKRGGLCKREQFGARFNVWRYANGRDNSSKDRIAFSHPAIMPEQLASDHITTWSNEGDMVYEPFAGSGTTGKMAFINKRKCIMSEISLEYCELSKQRLLPYTSNIGLFAQGCT